MTPRAQAAGVIALVLLALASRADGQVPPKAAPATAKAAPTSPTAPVAITHARLHTGAGAVIDDATVVIAGGKIQAVGKGVAVPAGATTVDAKGQVVTPGLVEPLTSMGLIEVDAERAARDDSQNGRDRIRAAFRAADGYNPASTVIPVTRLEGVTSVGVMPTGGLVSGQSAWADLDGAAAADAIAEAPIALHVHLDPYAEPEGGGRAGAIHRVREAFDDARAFQRNRAAWERNQSRPFAPSRLDLEALGRALGGKLPVVFHVDRAADIATVLALAKELTLRPIIAGGAEAWKVSAALAAAKVPVIVLPLLAGPLTFDMIAMREDNAALLHAAGVPVILAVGETHGARKLRQAAGNAVRAGFPHDAAIAAITRAPADAFGMGARYGTLAPGKVANVVVWSGDPLELSTRVVEVYIRGKKVDLRSRQSALFDRYRTRP